MQRWHGPGGYAQVLEIGLPLVMSMMSHSIMQFTDRIFLAHYSLESIAASLPAAITSFLFISFFMGVAEYVSVFVAQYTGAVRPRKVGAAMWQGLWFCVPAAVILASLALVSGPIFELAGHSMEIRTLEVNYFNVLTIGAGFAVVATSLSCFYSGRGMTIPVMLVNMTGAAVNIPLDYALINGWGWFPELGIVGAGLATVTGSAVMVALFGLMIFTRKNDEAFGVRSMWRPDKDLFLRFLRFGLPGGVNFFIDMFAVTFFVFMIGRVGDVELAATNMVISLDILAFMPVIGMGIAASVLVGQSIGAGTPELGRRATFSAMQLSMVWMGLLALTFVTLPEPLLGLFRERGMSEVQFAGVVAMGTVMLRFVAVYSLVDAVLLTLFGALKGAGDIRFVMWSMVVCSSVVMIGPISLLLAYADTGFYGPWTCLTLYVLVLAAVAWFRFRSGKWMHMQVIEDEEAEIQPA